MDYDDPEDLAAALAASEPSTRRFLPHLYPSPTRDLQLARVLLDDMEVADLRMLSMMRNKRLVGFVPYEMFTESSCASALSKPHRSGYVQQIFIASCERGAGVASRAMQLLHNQLFRARGACQHVDCNVSPDKAPCLRVLDKCAFQCVRRWPHDGGSLSLSRTAWRQLPSAKEAAAAQAAPPPR